MPVEISLQLNSNLILFNTIKRQFQFQFVFDLDSVLSSIEFRNFGTS